MAELRLRYKTNHKELATDRMYTVYIRQDGTAVVQTDRREEDIEDWSEIYAHLVPEPKSEPEPDSEDGTPPVEPNSPPVGGNIDMTFEVN